MPTISRAHIDGYARILRLREDQREAVRLLHEGYLQAAAQAEGEARATADKIARRYADIDPGEDPEAVQERLRETGRVAAAYYHAALALHDGLLEDIHATLDEEQMSRWGRVLRKRRRDLVMSELADLSWAQVDLVDCLETLGIDEGEGALREQVVRYELDVDRPLGMIYGALLELFELMPRVMAERDRTPLLEVMETAYEGMGRLRSINKRHARIISTMLAEDERGEFQKLTRERAFPRVYEASQVVRSISSARGLADLTAEQRESLDGMLDEYQRRATPLNEAWAAAIDASDDDADPVDEFHGTREESPELIEARAARFVLDERFLVRLESLLSPDQWQRRQESPR